MSTTESTEGTVYTALRPIQVLTKIFGFSLNTGLKKAKGNTSDILGIIHVAFIIMLKVLLIYYNLDPSKFKNVTNSAILNSGLWIQTEASLIISILYIVIGIRKSNDMFKLLQQFNAIDQEFTKSFFLKYHYVQARHWISLFVVSGVLIHFTLILITTYYLWDLPFERCHKMSILVAIYFSNICIYAIANQYLCAQLYLSSRFQNVNDVLSQLIFDEPISDGILLMDNQVAVEADATFVVPMGHHMRKKRSMTRDVLENNDKSGVTFIESAGDDDDDVVRINYSFDKEFPQSITRKPAVTAKTKLCKKVKFTPLSVIAYKTSITKLAFTRSSSIADISKKLNKLMELHDRLCDCMDLCNYLLAVQVLLISLTICVYIVFGLFAKYRVWMDYQHEADNVAQMNIYWIVVYSIFITLGTYVSSGLMQTVKETAIIVHRIACRYDSTVLLNKLSRISQMLQSRKTTVGCGLIAFDWSTIFTLFGSVCMYLIILIQFYINGKSNKIQQSNLNNDTSVL